MTALRTKLLNCSTCCPPAAQGHTSALVPSQSLGTSAAAEASPALRLVLAEKPSAQSTVSTIVSRSDMSICAPYPQARSAHEGWLTATGRGAEAGHSRLGYSPHH